MPSCDTCVTEDLRPPLEPGWCGLTISLTVWTWINKAQKAKGWVAGHIITTHTTRPAVLSS